MFIRRPSNRGQVLIIFVVAIVGLIGLTGLAIDGSNIYADRRQAQNAADTAALAAALARNTYEKASGPCNNFNTATGVEPACSSSTIYAAINIAGQNGYTTDIVNTRVDVYSPPIDGTYSTCGLTTFDCHDYIEVVIKDSVNTWFARVLGVTQLHNQVEAVALAHYSAQTSLYNGMTLVELGEDKGACPSDFNVGGSGTVNLYGGGIYVNSANTNCAYKQTSCSTTINLYGTPPASIDVVGTADTNTCTTPPITPVTYQYPFPPAPLLDVLPPPECATAGTFGPSGSGTAYTPGNYYAYKNFPVNNDISTLAPGVYCINDLNNLQNGGLSMTGTGVMFYLRPTGQITISGETVNVSAPTSGTYKGILIYQDWDQSSSTVNCSIEGNTGSSYSGLIFVPYCGDMKLTGTTSSTGFESQIIAYTITLEGTTVLNFTYDANSGPKIPEKDFTGLNH